MSHSTTAQGGAGTVTDAQRWILERMARGALLTAVHGARSAGFGADRVALSTVGALVRRGLVEVSSERHHSLTYRITDAGRGALAKAEGRAS